MHEPNEKKIELWKNSKSTYKRKFLKFLRDMDPCQHPQVEWIKTNIPFTKAGRKFVKDYIITEKAVCLESDESYHRYANLDRFEYLLLWRMGVSGPVKPPVKKGQTVIRGPDWKWWDQDVDPATGKYMVGVTVSDVFTSVVDDWIRVKWSNGTENTYWVGKHMGVILYNKKGPYVELDIEGV